MAWWVLSGRHASKHGGAAMPESLRDDPDALSWRISTPLLTNRFMFLDFLRWMGLTAAAMALIAGVIGLVIRDAQAFLGILALFGLICAGMSVLFVLIMLFYFGNRMDLAYRLDARGVNALVADRRGKAANRAAVVLGVLAGKPGAVGAGLLARAQENTRVDFADVRRARFSPRQRVISLRDRWWRSVRLYCTDKSYQEAERRVREGLGRHGRQARIVFDAA